MFPAWLRDEGLALDGDGKQRRPNPVGGVATLPGTAGVEELFYHALAVLHDPAYREANAGALRWPNRPSCRRGRAWRWGRTTAIHCQGRPWPRPPASRGTT